MNSSHKSAESNQMRRSVQVLDMITIRRLRVVRMPALLVVTDPTDSLTKTQRYQPK